MIAQLQEEIVQGPLDHPRLGRILLVCPTIETTRIHRFPSQAVVVTAVARKLIELARTGERIQALIVQGGAHDATKHPEFHEISENLRQLLDKHFPKASLCLLAEATLMESPQIRHALSFYDQPVLRLDAGTQKTYAALTGEDPKVFRDMVERLGKLGNGRLIVQTRFVRGEVDNSNENEVKAWLRHISEIKPAGVHITTPAKAKGKKEIPVTKTRMTQIAEMVTSKTGIPVEVLTG